MPRGRVVLEEWEIARIEEREAVHITQSCLWCSWSVAGPLGTVREAHRQHRLSVHPDRKVRERRKRFRPARQFHSATNLDDNIANARAQGAATWEGATD